MEEMTLIIVIVAFLSMMMVELTPSSFFGTRTLTEYYEGSVPNDDYLDDSSSSHEIIGYYSTDGTDKDMHKTFYPFARRLN